MFADQLRRAVEASPRFALTKVSALLWRADAGGHITEAQASELSETIEARKIVPIPAPRRVGSRPRSSASLERRRRWAGSGALPPGLASRFTLGEAAVLAVIAAEQLRHGRCTLTNEHLAALAGVSRTTVKRALRAARGLIRVEERRVSAWRNKPNISTILSAEWLTWLKRRGVGSKLGPPRILENIQCRP